jgi:glycosyltransferase involved in cell wall biosynthesis
MKTVSNIDESEVKGAIRTQLPVKVCIHLLKKARSDVRSKRAAEALIRAGYAVSIVDVESERTIPKEENIDGVRLKHMIVPNWFTSRCFQPWFFLVAMRTFLLSINRLLQTQADIYHASELTALPASYIVAKLRRKPLIFEAYELHLPVPHTDVVFWRPLGGVLMRLLALILPRCAGVIAASPLYAREFCNRYHLPDVITIRNVLEYQPVAKSERIRRYLGLSPDVRIALYQGRLQRNRGLDRLVRAARFLEQDIVIVMMGEWQGMVRSEIEALIANEGVGDRVKIIPQVPYEELLEWTASADIGLTILPPDYSLSIRMTLPNKLFEYLMAGLPVLSSELDAIAAVIKTYDVGDVVGSLAPTDVGAAINAMFADRVALERMHHNALNAAKECCWEKESQHLIRLYQSLA